MPLGMEVGLVPGDVVLDGDRALPQKGHNPQFSAHVYCGQTTEWIKARLGTEIGLGTGHIAWLRVVQLLESLFKWDF